MRAYFHSNVKPVNLTKGYPSQIRVLAESVKSIYSSGAPEWRSR